MRIDILFSGFPGKTNRGFLGWSSCILIRMKSQPPLLFDTAGFNERVVLLDKLGKLGVSPQEVGGVFLSHFHFDHVPNYGMFNNAVYYLHELEVHHIQNHHHNDLAVPYEMFPSLKNTGRLSVLSGSSGSVHGLNWVHTPGHTPGLYSLFLEYGGERWVLASDAVKNRTELVTGSSEMTYDSASSSASIRKIRNYADIVVPGHDDLLRVKRKGDEIEVQSVLKSGVEVIIQPADESLSKTVVLESC